MVSGKHTLYNTDDNSNNMLILLLVSHPLKISTLKNHWEFSGGLCTSFLYSLCPDPTTKESLCGWLGWHWLLNPWLSMEHMESGFTFSLAIMC